MEFEVDSHGRVFRNKDHQPLRTKIVATIGSTESYETISTFEEQELKQGEYTYADLVTGFIKNGVDVIRLNLTHIDAPEVPAVYTAVRAAVLDCEKLGGATDKKIAVLADLPGPKIRFNFTTPMTFVMNAPFRVRFARSDDDRGLVYVGHTPLKEAMAAADETAADAMVDLDESVERLKIIENLLGSSTGGADRADRFTTMMQSIRQRLRDEVLVRIGDGEVVLRVQSVGPDYLDCTVISAKEPTLSKKKGFTLKGVDLEIPSFTAADEEKLDALLQAEYDGLRKDGRGELLTFVALSFAQTASDVLRAKSHIHTKLRELQGDSATVSNSSEPAVIAKIESKKGWDNRELILDVADGVMVARGDLGLQMEIESVPAIQKTLIKLCNKRGKPVITATEMLKSMTSSIEPTRAEGSDVFNAILDGSDAVMMSEETSKGRYPFHSVRKMIAIAVQAELYAEFKGMEDAAQQRNAYQQQFQEFFLDAESIIARNARRFDDIAALLSPAKFRRAYLDARRAEIAWVRELYEKKAEKTAKQRTTDRITQSTCSISEAQDIVAILAPTTSGRTTRMIARIKPRRPVIGAAHDILNTRKLIISYGVWPICIGAVDKTKDGPEEMFHLCLQNIGRDERLNRLLANRDVIFTAGSPIGEPGTTNLIQIKRYQPARMRDLVPES